MRRWSRGSPGRSRTADPLGRWLQPSAITRSTDGAARSPISRARASDGRSMSGAGSCSRPMNTFGSPLSSRISPSPRTISVGGGRTPSTTAAPSTSGRSAEARERSRAAMTPPASHRMRTAWAAPTMRPADAVERAEEARAERLRGGASARRAERLAEPDQPEQHGQHDDRADRGGHAVEQRGDGRQDRQAGERGNRRAGEAEELGQRAGSEPQQDRDHEQAEREQVQRVHRRIVTHVTRRGVSGRSTAYGTSSLIAGASPSAEIVQVPAASVRGRPPSLAARRARCTPRRLGRSPR